MTRSRRPLRQAEPVEPFREQGVMRVASSASSRRKIRYGTFVIRLKISILVLCSLAVWWSNGGGTSLDRTDSNTPLNHFLERSHISISNNAVLIPTVPFFPHTAHLTNARPDDTSLFRIYHHDLTPLRILADADGYNITIASTGEMFNVTAKKTSTSSRGDPDPDPIVSFEQEKQAHLVAMDVPLSQRQRREDRKRRPGCRPPSWTMTSLHQYPTCHSFHEIDRTASYSTARALGHGHFRNAHVWSNHENDDTMGRGRDNDYVLKTVRLVEYQNFAQEELDLTRKEALILERLTSAVNIANIFGFCGTSTLTERGIPIVDDVLMTVDGGSRGRVGNLTAYLADPMARSQNNMTVAEKLDMAIDMVQAVAEIHGYRESVIIGYDITPNQFLRRLAKDKETTTERAAVFLNDLNSALFQEWHSEEQRYCSFYKRAVIGHYRSPEQLEGGYLDEQADIWPVGNLLYTLLTGLYTYNEVPSIYLAKIDQMAIEGVPPKIHPAFDNNSSFAKERAMVEAMRLCHVRKPSSRADIFTVLQRLREAKKTKA